MELLCEELQEKEKKQEVKKEIKRQKKKQKKAKAQVCSGNKSCSEILGNETPCRVSIIFFFLMHVLFCSSFKKKKKNFCIYVPLLQPSIFFIL